MALWIIHDFSYEKSFKDADKIYRIIEVAKQNGVIEKHANTYLPLAQELRNNFPIFENTTFIKYESPRALSYEETNLECKPGYVDKYFFDVFDFEFIEGNPTLFSTKQNGIILTEDIAYKLFGKEKALGKTLTNTLYSFKYIYEIVGVIKMPKNTHFSFDIILDIDEIMMWISELGWKKPESFCTYVKLKENVAISENQQKEMSSFLSKYKETTSKLWFQPITDIHLFQDFNYYHDKHLGNIKIVLLNSLLALLLLAISIFNFVNLNLSRSTNRFKEIAIRKVTGGTRIHLMIQFFSETIILSIIAVYLGAIFAELFRPVFSNIINISITIPYNFKMILYFLIAGIIMGLFSGSYSAIILSRLSPKAIFSQNNPKSFNSKLIKILTIVQFAVTSCILIIGFFIQNQLNYIKNKDLGIDKENIIILKTGLWYDIQAFDQELMKNPNIISATGVMNSPVDFYWKNKDVRWEGMNTNEPVTMTEVFVDEGFWKTYGIELIEGDFYNTDFEAFWNSDKLPALVNESAYKIIGKKDIIGTRIDNLEIVGVVKDFHFKSLYEPISPLIISYNPEAIFEVNIRIKPDNTEQTLAYIKDIYLKHRPERVFEYSFFDDLIDQKYQNEKRLSQIILWFLVFSLIIALSGIIGMVVFTTTKRTKEIAIRKVNGARLHNILILFGKEYFVNLIIAFIIGSIIAAKINSKWINNFAYHIDQGFLTYLIPFLVLFTITLITITIILNKATRKNPTESLRYE